MKRSSPASTVQYVSKRHAEKIAFYEDQRDVKLPQTRDRLAKFEAVLENRGELTDAMVNAVFKKSALLKNARRPTEEFMKETKTTPEVLKERAREHQNYLRRLKGKNASKLTDSEQAAIRDHVAKLHQWCDSVESGVDYMDYMQRTAKLVEMYAEENAKVQLELEQENRERAADSQEKKQRGRKRKPAPKHNDILNIMKTGQLKREQQQLVALKEQTREVSTYVSRPPRAAQVSIDEYVGSSNRYMRLRELQADYYAAIDEPDPSGSIAVNTDPLTCKDCGVQRCVDLRQAQATCPQCGVAEYYQEQTLSSVPFGDPINLRRTGKSYEPRNHYMKWKRQVTGELKSDLPEELYERVYEEFNRRRWGVVTLQKTRKVLNMLGYQNYYDNAQQITYQFNEVPLANFSPEENRILDSAFETAYALFGACPMEIKRRSNFLSYAYFYYQICYMNQWDHYLKCFPLLDGEDHLRRHDRTWKWMCEHKTSSPRWTFYPTI